MLTVYGGLFNTLLIKHVVNTVFIYCYVYAVRIFGHIPLLYHSNNVGHSPVVSLLTGLVLPACVPAIMC